MSNAAMKMGPKVNVNTLKYVPPPVIVRWFDRGDRMVGVAHVVTPAGAFSFSADVDMKKVYALVARKMAKGKSELARSLYAEGMRHRRAAPRLEGATTEEARIADSFAAAGAGAATGMKTRVEVGATPSSFTAQAGWYRPAVDALEMWRRYQKRDPTQDEANLLARQIFEIKRGMATHDESVFEHHHGVLEFLARHGRMPTGYPKNVGQNAILVRQALSRVASHVSAYYAAHPSGGLGSILTSVARATGVAQILDTVKKVTEAIPIIGKPLATVEDLAASPMNLAGSILKGERIDRAFIDQVKAQVKDVKELAPYVTTVMSLVPGVGTTVAAAVAMGTALAEGRPVTDAALSSLRQAVPGGEIGKVAFDTAMGAMHGRAPELGSAARGLVSDALQSAVSGYFSAGADPSAPSRLAPMTKDALSRLRASFPPAARKGFDVAVAAAVARHIQARRGVLRPPVLSGIAAHVRPENFVLPPVSAKTAGAFAAANRLASVLAHARALKRAGLPIPKDVEAELLRVAAFAKLARAGKKEAVKAVKLLRIAEEFQANVRRLRQNARLSSASLSSLHLSPAAMKGLRGVETASEAAVKSAARKLSAHAAGAWAPRIVMPGEPTGDIFFG